MCRLYVLPHRFLARVAFPARGACRPCVFTEILALCFSRLHLPVSLVVSPCMIPHSLLRRVAGFADVAYLWFPSINVSPSQVHPSHGVVPWRYSEVTLFLRPPGKSLCASVLLRVRRRSAIFPSGACEDVVRQHSFPAFAMFPIVVFPYCRFPPAFVTTNAKYCHRVFP